MLSLIHISAVGDFAFRHLVVQVNGAFLASHHFVDNYEVAVVYEEYGTAVFQVLVARILGNQYLYVAFRPVSYTHLKDNDPDEKVNELFKGDRRLMKNR